MAYDCISAEGNRYTDTNYNDDTYGLRIYDRFIKKHRMTTTKKFWHRELQKEFLMK
ncbi:MAG: hypothetical protein HFI05_00765 [Lachnospiraceae bacterium]|nr:hypothetical protein [Lachnospiraceae bacterium]